MRLGLLAFLCALLCSVVSSSSNAAAMSLPVPEGLEADVKFWEKVFGRYKKNECIFHDRENLGIIYLVKKIPGSSPAETTYHTKRYVAAIKAAMTYLGGGGEPRNLLERRIVEVTPAEDRSPAYFRLASDNVRCQRGVDLGASMERSKQHLKMVKRVLAQRGVPDDLAYLPHLESGYDITAHSRAGARGVWQLMPATARLLGLRVGRRGDQRTDTYRATVAAVRMLDDLHRKTGSWPLAITGYNYGPNGIVRAIRKYGPDYMKIRENHSTPIFGFAAKNYYPSFLAVRNIALQVENGGNSEASGPPVALEDGRRTPRL